MKSAKQRLFDIYDIKEFPKHKVIIDMSDIADYMEIHAAEVRTETIAETRSEMMEFAEWYRQKVDYDSREEAWYLKDHDDNDDTFFYHMIDVLNFWLTNIKGK